LAIFWHVQYYYYVQRLEEEYVDESVTRGRVKVNTCSSGSNTNAPCMYATGCSNKPVMTQQQKQRCTYWLMKVPCHNADAARPATVGP
jgi:hypothetical protein